MSDSVTGSERGMRWLLARLGAFFSTPVRVDDMSDQDRRAFEAGFREVTSIDGSPIASPPAKGSPSYAAYQRGVDAGMAVW